MDAAKSYYRGHGSGDETLGRVYSMLQRVGLDPGRYADRYPETNFAIIDMVVDRPNVASIVFREHEGSYLVGSLAARKSKSGVVGIVKGLDVPLLMKFEHGYRQGFTGTTTLVLADFGIPDRLGPDAKEAELTLHVEGIRK